MSCGLCGDMRHSAKDCSFNFYTIIARNNTKPEVPMEDQKKPEQALRFNQGKLPYDEICPHFEEEIAKVILYGQKKYGRFNWMKGAPTSQFYGCIRRHLSALYKGEDIDQESGCTHIGHIATNLMMLHYNLRTKPENDDRVFAKKESL